MNDLKLHGTPLSHFTRKIRILLEELGVPFEFVRTPGVLSLQASAYGDNPLMRVPTLVHGDDLIIDSDHIARYLVARYDPDDRLGVRSERVRDLNRLAVINGIMANEVVLILAKRGGLSEPERFTYFKKLADAIDAGLVWLDGAIDPEPESFSYIDIAMTCMWQHLAYYTWPLGSHPAIAARVARVADRPSIAHTTPEVSLAEAIAAGWKPG